MLSDETEWLDNFFRENSRDLTGREREFVIRTTLGMQSPSAAAREMGFKSPRTSAAQILRRPHVHNLRVAIFELARELMIAIKRDLESEND